MAGDGMSGEEWLTRIFDPALRRTDPPFQELRGALRALTECGTLSEQSALPATARMNEIESQRRTVLRQRVARADPTGRRATLVAERLEGSLTPSRPLGEITGITVVLALVELWASRLILRLEAKQSEITAALDAKHDAEWAAYEARWAARHSNAEVHEDHDVTPPAQPSVSVFAALPLCVTDDLGTRYHAFGTATGGPDRWRSEWRIEPGVPSSATLLRVALEGDLFEPNCVELALPARN